MKFLTAQSTVSAVVVLSFGLVLTLLLFVSVPAGSERFLDVLLGVLAAKWGTVVDYYMGSSAGSRGKDDTISALATQQTK